MRCVSHKTERAYVVCHSDNGGGGTLFYREYFIVCSSAYEKTQMNVWHASKFSELYTFLAVFSHAVINYTVFPVALLNCMRMDVGV